MYEMIKWRVEDDERDAVISFINENHITGIYTPPTTKRYYPKNSLAAQVIGWVNYSEGRGAYGVEAQYDEALSGETGGSSPPKTATAHRCSTAMRTTTTPLTATI